MVSKSGALTKERTPELLIARSSPEMLKVRVSPVSTSVADTAPVMVVWFSAAENTSAAVSTGASLTLVTVMVMV